MPIPPGALRSAPAHLDGLLGGEGAALQLQRVAGHHCADGGGGGGVCLHLVAVRRAPAGAGRVRGGDEHVEGDADLHVAEVWQRVDGRGLALDEAGAQQGGCQQAGSRQEGAGHGAGGGGRGPAGWCRWGGRLRSRGKQSSVFQRPGATALEPRLAEEARAVPEVQAVQWTAACSPGSWASSPAGVPSSE